MAPPQTKCAVVVDGSTIEEITEYDYTDDALAIAEEVHFTVDNTGRKYRDLLQIGAEVKFILQHPDVNGGAPTTKHIGRIVDRRAAYDKNEGSVIKVVSGDKGWHLVNSDAPLWLRLDHRTYRDVCDPSTSKLFDPSWGFKGVRFDGDLRRSLKQGRKILLGEQGDPIQLLHVIQIEPGEKVADKLIEYSRRENLLVNVAPDGTLCCWRPDYSRAPAFSIRNRAGDPQNNVEIGELIESAKTRYTEVVVVGEQIAWEGDVEKEDKDKNSPNSTKKRGCVRHPEILPFANRHTRADGEMYENYLAQKHAEWVYKRGRFDSWGVRYRVSEHYQGSRWYGSDEMIHVDDQEIGKGGIRGNFWVQSVRCVGSKSGGDYAELMIREAGLLSASLGRIPDPSLTKSSMKGKPTEGK